MRDIEELKRADINSMSPDELRLLAIFAAQQLGFWNLAKLWAGVIDICH